MRIRKNIHSAHFALTAVFIIGNTIINLPFGRGIEGAVSGFILCVAASIPLFFMLSRVQRSLNGKSLGNSTEYIFGKITGRALSILFSAFCMLCAVACMRNFLSFADNQILPFGKTLLPSVLFTALAVVLCFVKKAAVIKLAFISFILTVAAEIFLLLCSLSQMSIDNLMPILGTDITDTLYQAISYFAMSFAQCTVLLAFFMGYTKSEENHTYKAGVLAGAAVLILCLVHTLSVFGFSYTGTLRFPYALAMSTVTVGDKFIRLEGFSYLIYFFCCLIKTAVCIISAREVLKNITGRYTKYLPIISGIILIIFSALNDFFRPLEFIRIAPWFLVPAIGFPVILLIGYQVKNRIRCRCKTR